MLYSDEISASVVIVVTIIMLICLVVTVAYIKFSRKHQKKYKEIFSKYQILEELNRVIVDEFIDKIYTLKLLTRVTY